MKSVGLNIILAQMGMFVPCKEMSYYPFEYILTRICGNDNIFKGQSSFAVEMEELRGILLRAKENSLVLGDEICSGTEYISAQSIIAASLKRLYKNGSKYIFATHLHELIEIDEISARLQCEVVLDGIDRYKVKNKVEATKFIPSAKIIRLKKDSTAISALAKKVQLAEDLHNMPPSSKLLLKILEYEGSMTQKEIASKTMLPDRTVRLAMSHLLEKGYVKRKVSIRDSRQKIYEITKLDY